MSTTTQRDPAERTHAPANSKGADCRAMPSTMSANPAEYSTNDPAVSALSLMDEGFLSAHTASTTRVTTPTNEAASRAPGKMPMYCG